jgi:WD40 repeat protein
MKDNNKVVLAYESSFLIKLWNLKDYRVLMIYRGHKGIVYGVEFSKDEKLLASGSGDFTLKLWEVITGNNVHTFTGF